MNLRKQLIHLAHSKPELREHLLSIIKEADFNPEDIGREVGGPLESIDSDEAFMGGEFTQQENRDLREHQEAGQLPAAQPVVQSPQPGKQAVEKKADMDPSDIGREVAGPLDSIDNDEPYMSGEFTQQEHRELREEEQAGNLPSVSTEPRSPSSGKQARLARLRRLRELRKTADMNPSDIGREVGGPLESLDGDEAYMPGEFTQQENRELRETQESGRLPGVTTEPRGPTPGKQAEVDRLAELRAMRQASGKIPRMAKKLADMKHYHRLAELRKKRADGGDEPAEMGWDPGAVTDTGYDPGERLAELRAQQAQQAQQAGTLNGPNQAIQSSKPEKMVEIMRTPTPPGGGPTAEGHMAVSPVKMQEHQNRGWGHLAPAMLGQVAKNTPGAKWKQLSAATLVRLAFEKPELREHLLPLLKAAGCEKLPDALKEQCEKKVEEGKKNKESEGDDKDKTAGCEKLPNEAMQEACEKKKEEGKESDKDE